MVNEKRNRKLRGEKNQRPLWLETAVDAVRAFVILTGLILFGKYPLESVSVSVFGFLALFGLLRYFRRENGRSSGWAVGFSVCYALAMVIGREMWINRTISGLLTWSGFFRALLTGAAIGQLVQQLIQWVFAKTDAAKPGVIKLRRTQAGRFLVFWGLILLAWMPCYLAYYPGINAYDLEAQTRQVLGIMPVTTEHPPLHTAIWAFCIWIGDRIDVTGYALYGLWQMMTLSAAMAAAVSRLWNRGYAKPAVYGSVAFFALNPVIAIMSFNPTKDIVFAAVFLVYLTFLPDLIEKEKPDAKSLLGMSLLTALSCLLRNNAIYTMGLTLIMLLILFGKARRQVLIVHLCGMLAAGAVMWGIYPMMGIQPGNKKEAMSVPIQQISRILTAKADTMAKEELEEISAFFDIEKTVSMYNPRLSEPVKDYCFSEEALRENTSGFLQLWGKTVLRDPGTAVDAFLDLHLPYWYPEAETIDEYSQRSYIETIQRCWIYGLVPKNLLPGLHAWYESVADYSLLRKIPVLNTVFSIQLPLWLMLFCFCMAGYRKRLRQTAAVIPAFFYWLFFLLAPGSNFRYVFPLMTAYPLLLCCAALSGDGEQASVLSPH